MDQRIHRPPRHPLNVPVEIVCAERRVETRQLSNISLGGAFVKTPRPLPAGSLVRLRLAVGDLHLKISAWVVHTSGRRSADTVENQLGMGVAFLGMETPERQALWGALSLIGAGRASSGAVNGALDPFAAR